MRYLRTNTAVIITVGPFYDKTDGVTIETGLTITNERITLTADTDAGSAPTNILDNIAGATSGTANDLNYITGNDAGMMQLELAAADVNRLGRMFLSITDAANHCPVFHEFMILPAVVYDSMVLGTDLFDVSLVQISGSGVTTSAAQLGVNVVNVGAVAQTGRDLGASVLLSSGTGTGQLDFTSGVVKANAVQLLGTAWLTPGTAGTPDVNVKLINAVSTSAVTTIKAVQGLAVDGVITTLTNLPAITANWITAAGINADAFTAAKFASDVGTEFATAVWASGTRALTTLAGLTVDTVTTLTNLPAITTNWLTAAGTAADFTVEIQTGLSTLTAAQVNAEVDTALTDYDGPTNAELATALAAADDAVLVQVALVKAKTDNLPSDPADESLIIAATDAIMNRIGVAGAGLTALGDVRIANLDAAISTRMATFTLPANFAAFSLTAGGLVTLSPTANVFNGITPDAAFFTNAAAGSGLTAQQTRDAMKLAPSVGAAAAGSIDDQLADIQTSVDALSAGSGTGAYIVTVTVTDGTDPLQNAKIRLIEGVTPYTATTNASGVATFSLDAATYSIAITKAGYQFTPSTIVVTAAGNFDKAMTPRVIPPSANPDVCRVGAWVQTNSGLPLVGVFMFAKRTGTDPASAGALIEAAEVTSILPSDADGFVFIDLILPSEITPAALEYAIRIPAVNYTKPVTPTGATFEIELP